MIGTIFDIQRFSVHDGPGIRTTVFMKGCPLRCQWCHNPEGLFGNIQLQYFKEHCIKCGRCGTRTSLEDAAKCPTEALKVCGRKLEATEVFQEVLKDQLFYGEDGGVTFSGGECLLQADFVAEVLAMAKEQGISTVVDTSGYVPWQSFEKVLDVCDLFLYDIKTMDREKHKQYTGVDNGLILENLCRLAKRNKPVWIRVPVIPDVNDSIEEISRIAEFLKQFDNIKDITLMPYHTLGKSKYETLGLTCPYGTDKQITKQKLAEFEQIMKEVNGYD